MSESVEDGRTIRPFTQFLVEYRHGGLNNDVSEALNQLTQAVMGTGKGGKLTVVVSVKPAGRQRDMVIVSDDVKLALPAADREEAVFFVDHDANLTRSNPNQSEMPFIRDLGGKDKIREVNE